MDSREYTPSQKVLEAKCEMPTAQEEKKGLISKQLVAQLPFIGHDRLLNECEELKRPYGYRKTFPINLDELSANLQISVSPSREMMEQYLKTDNHLHEDTRKIYSAVVNHQPDLHRIIEVEITDGNGTIIGMSELHIVKDGTKVVAVGPLHRTHLSRTNDREFLESLGDIEAAQKKGSQLYTMPVGYPSQVFTNALLVNKKFQGKGIGKILVNAGTALASILGAKERLFWTDSTGRDNENSYYLRFGAKMKETKFRGKSKTIPVLELK